MLRVQHRLAAERAQAERIAERRADSELLEQRKELLRAWVRRLAEFAVAVRARCAARCAVTDGGRQMRALSERIVFEALAQEHEASFSALCMALLARAAREQSKVEVEMHAAEAAARSKFESQLSDFDQLMCTALTTSFLFPPDALVARQTCARRRASGRTPGRMN
jgi:hypothetical protein